MMTGQNAMGIMWNRDKATRTEQKKLRRMFIAEIQWKLQTDAFVGNNKTNWGKVKRSTHIRRRWQNILTNLHEVIG
jgi:hypothetical protein